MVSIVKLQKRYLSFLENDYIFHKKKKPPNVLNNREQHEMQGVRGNVMNYISLESIIKEFGLIRVTKVGKLDEIKIVTANVNRPGIHLLGYFEIFDTKRIQIFGSGEMSFLETLEDSQRKDIIDKFFSYPLPCVVIARNIKPFPEMIEASIKNNIPLLKTNQVTSTFLSSLIRYLNYELAPRTTLHGVQVDVYGEGILITGESGIGKSETALELIKRGHSLVSDDVVEIRKVSDKTLIGVAPDIVKNFIEIRGLGVIDVKQVFGVSAIKDSYRLCMVIKLEYWDSSKEYDRLGIKEQTIDILGIKLTCITVPVKPGRNLAVIVEAAAMNFKEKRLGYDAAQVLSDRLSQAISQKSKNTEI